MSFVQGTNHDYRGDLPNFERDKVATKELLLKASPNEYDDGHLVYCEEDKKTYKLDKSAAQDAVTGYFHPFGEGGVSSEDIDKKISDAIGLFERGKFATRQVALVGTVFNEIPDSAPGDGRFKEMDDRYYPKALSDGNDNKLFIHFPTVYPTDDTMGTTGWGDWLPVMPKTDPNYKNTFLNNVTDFKFSIGLAGENYSSYSVADNAGDTAGVYDPSSAGLVTAAERKDIKQLRTDLNATKKDVEALNVNEITSFALSPDIMQDTSSGNDGTVVKASYTAIGPMFSSGVSNGQITVSIAVFNSKNSLSEPKEVYKNTRSVVKEDSFYLSITLNSVNSFDTATITITDGNNNKVSKSVPFIDKTINDRPFMYAAAVSGSNDIDFDNLTEDNFLTYFRKIDFPYPTYRLNFGVSMQKNVAYIAMQLSSDEASQNESYTRPSVWGTELFNVNFQKDFVFGGKTYRIYQINTSSNAYVWTSQLVMGFVPDYFTNKTLS